MGTARMKLRRTELEEGSKGLVQVKSGHFVCSEGECVHSSVPLSMMLLCVPVLQCSRVYDDNGDNDDDAVHKRDTHV